MEKLISFIIPVYNVEKYVKRCIFSIVSQITDHTLFDLIIVNDGSTDSSLNVILELQKEYPFIQIINTENKGLSEARNKGLEVATAKYIFFIDSDDWIEPGSLIYLMKAIEEKDTDIILFGIREILENGNTNELNSALSPNNQIIAIDEYSVQYTIRSSAWNGLFKHQLFKDGNYRFRSGFYCEDDDFVIKIFSLAKNLVSIHHNIYNYFQRNNSISNNTHYDANIKLITDRIVQLRDNLQYIECFSKQKHLGLKRKLDFCAVDIIRLIIQKKIKKEDADIYIKELQKIGFYPLPKGEYGYKYNIFRFIVNRKTLMILLPQLGLRRFF